jgi:hypothetical protein
LLCGLPILASAGAAHAIRSNDDVTTTTWPFNFSSVKSSMNNVAFRFFVNPFVTNDPDATFIKDLLPSQKRVHLTALALAGRLFNVGDDITRLPEADIALIAKVLAFTAPLRDFPYEPDVAFRPLDLTERPREQPEISKFLMLLDPDSYSVPSVWMTATKSGEAYLALLNFERTERRFSLSHLAGYSVGQEAWTGKRLSIEQGALQLTVPPQDAALFRLSP